MRPLLERIRNREIDPTFILSHRMSLEEAPKGYDIFKHKQDECTKVVLTPGPGLVWTTRLSMVDVQGSGEAAAGIG